MQQAAPKTPQPDATPSIGRSSLAAMGLSALGIVFGDIGTSPLYTLKTVLDLTGGTPAPGTVLGVLSLILWTLIIITSVKYVTVAMSIDNDGEGGILALMALLGIKKHQRPAIVAVGLFGAALIYGDGAITPAISVLSALEGLNIATPALKSYVLPAAVAILVALFAIQPLGTSRIGKAFGPSHGPLVFVNRGARHLGDRAASGGLRRLQPPRWASLSVLQRLRELPCSGRRLSLRDRRRGALCRHGAFRRRPIRLAWSGIVLPSLILNYAGQSAIVLAGAPATGNIFYRLCPEPLLIPFVVLATIATIIASQSIITGAFSMTRQAIQLGWLPRLRIKQTSEKGYGQIYVGVVNWLLMVATVGLTLFFGKSDNLASAYGIAVSATMLMTSALLFIAMREIWGWGLLASGAAAGAFLCVDASFFLANLVKVADGGYVPLVLASLVYAVMLIWHRGSAAVAQVLSERLVPVARVHGHGRIP